MNFPNLKINLPQLSSRSERIIKITSAIIIVLCTIIFFTINQFPLTGKLIDTEGYKIIPLNPEQRNIIEQSISKSEFVKDLPEEGPVFLRFYSFENGEHVWQDGFLVGKNGIMTQGKPMIYFSIHSKYIPDLEGDLCSVAQTAGRNGDVGIYSDYNKAVLFLKYIGMLKHRDCFGF